MTRRGSIMFGLGLLASAVLLAWALGAEAQVLAQDLGGNARSISRAGAGAALVAPPVRASEKISVLVRSALSRRLHVLSGEGRWRVAARCVRVRGSNFQQFRCAVWAQNLVREQDFWRTHVVVRCRGPLTLCRWQTTERFPVP